MKVSLNWLRTHLDLGTRTIPELSDLLTFAGVEVEGIDEVGVESELVVVAQVKESVPHPDADRLSICQVDDGSGTARQIVCGAKNYKVGDKVPLALPGATLPGGFTIKEGKLRGVASGGMMCSAKEIGVGENSDGLWILDAELKTGTPLKDIVPSDVVFDLEITPNRPDLLSHLGLARELAALIDTPLKGARDATASTTATTPASSDRVRIDDTAACPLYTARIVRGVKVGPSPAWLQERLESIGLRPINNVVDITNFILMEVGQPLHAFDLAKLDGGIVVRPAAEGEKFLALDEATYELTPDNLVIADNQKPVAIAGVMGGEDTGVTETTTDLLLEAAYFQPTHVRRTSRRLAIYSDSSYRFERGTDPHQVLGASEMAIKLILEIAGGIAEDTTIVAGEAPIIAGEVALDEPRTRTLLGIPDYKAQEGHAILEKLGLTKITTSDSESRWSIPSFRLDLHRSVDLAEEIARVIGLGRVQSSTSAAIVPTSAADRVYDHAAELRQALRHRGLYEAQTLRLISETQLADVPQKTEAANVRNPLSEDHTTLRPSLIPGLIATAALNVRQGAERLPFFEIGRVFLPAKKGMIREEERLAIALSGPAGGVDWANAKPAPYDVHHLTGMIAALPGLAGAAIIPKSIDDQPAFLLTHELRVGNRVIGWIARLHPARERDLDLRHPLWVAELPLSALRQMVQGSTKFEELPRFPAITRDLALEMASDLPQSDLAAHFGAQKEPLFLGAELFDLFRDPTGQKLPADRKSLAYTLTYRSPERTLETKEVDEAHKRIVEGLIKALPVTVR